jgi:hypothetical protein
VGGGIVLLFLNRYLTYLSLLSTRVVILSSMAPAAVADLYRGPTPVREHSSKQANVQASVLSGPKQLHVVCFPNFSVARLRDT